MTFSFLHYFHVVFASIISRSLCHLPRGQSPAVHFLGEGMMINCRGPALFPPNGFQFAFLKGMQLNATRTEKVGLPLTLIVELPSSYRRNAMSFRISRLFFSPAGSTTSTASSPSSPSTAATSWCSGTRAARAPLRPRRRPSTGPPCRPSCTPREATCLRRGCRGSASSSRAWPTRSRGS